MDAADLRIFEAVARLGSMSRAALALHTVQSNVTAHIRQLEARLGLALFERSGRGVRLTAAGARPLARLLAGEGDIRIIVLRAGCSYRQRLEEVLARRGIPAPRLLEFGTLEAIFASVAAGLGITLLPRALVGPVVRPGRLALEALPRGEGRVETVFARRRDCYASGALRAFLEVMRRQEARSVAAA
jgi:DNA-binding transcriptional LysR family regulator